MAKIKIHLRPCPYYEEFASDILANRDYRLMSLGEKGLLWQIRNECWVNGGVPSNIVELAKVLGCEQSQLDENLTPRVLNFLAKSGDSWTCPELDEQRENFMARREERVRSGSKGGTATQRKLRAPRLEVTAELQGQLETHLELVNRDEMNGFDKDRKELVGKELSHSELQDFVKEMEAEERTSSYKLQSREDKRQS